MAKKKPKFIRTDSFRFFKIGKKKRKLQVWRGAKGKHSKIRRQRKGYPKMPMIGFASQKKEAGKIQNLTPALVHNLAELQKLNKSAQIAIISRNIGAKKKIDLLKKADDLGIKVLNAGGKK